MHMFGKRHDGRRLRNIDPIVQFTPYIMPHRDDAQVFTRLNLDFEGMTRYIRDKRREGCNVTYMTLILAAYVRTVCENPEINRFIINKRLYSRNHICVSFVTLKKGVGDEIEESLCKILFNPDDTIYDVTERVEEAIEQARKPQDTNLTDKVARTLLGVPMLPNFVVALVRFLDNHDMMPQLIHDASPFHTSLFISNMASIGMSYIYHHIYNFGTTSVFVAMGKTEQQVHVNADGTCRSKRVLPLGVVIDERVAAGGVYSKAFATMQKYINNPTLLETPPEHVKTECDLLRVEQLKKQLNA